MNEELCIKCLEDLDVVMCNNWFPLTLRDKILGDILIHFKLTAKELAEYRVDRLGEKHEQN